MNRLWRLSFDLFVSSHPTLTRLAFPYLDINININSSRNRNSTTNQNKEEQEQENENSSSDSSPNFSSRTESTVLEIDPYDDRRQNSILRTICRLIVLFSISFSSVQLGTIVNLMSNILSHGHHASIEACDFSNVCLAFANMINSLCIFLNLDSTLAWYYKICLPCDFCVYYLCQKCMTSTFERKLNRLRNKNKNQNKSANISCYSSSEQSAIVNENENDINGDGNTQLKTDNTHTLYVAPDLAKS
jgi:hypothetical protein